MRNLVFYLSTVLIWGSTWIGIKMQLGVVEPMVSVAYRFSLAAFLLMLWCFARRLNMRFTPVEHGFMMLQGVSLFGFNYLLFYIAELHITSGLGAVIFSTIVVMNVINGTLILRTPLDPRVIVGGGLGLVGISLVFRQEITSFSLANDGMMGFLYCLVATLLASLGNITSARNQKHGLPIVQTNAWGMAYGAAALFIAIVVTGKQFSFDYSAVYIGSLLYLALFGSIVAFGCYLSLVGSIGADRAAYATLLFPLVALVISTIWEDYQWSVSSAVGVIFILTGNLWIIKKNSMVPGKLFLRAGQGLRKIFRIKSSQSTGSAV